MRHTVPARVENLVSSLALLAMVVLPILEIAVRRLFGVGVPGSGPIVQHLTLWVGFLGAAIAARDGKLLALATGNFIRSDRVRRVAGVAVAAVAACVALVLAWGGAQMVAAEREAQTTIGAGIPTWLAQSVLPIAFAIVAVRLVGRAGTTWTDKLCAASGLVVDSRMQVEYRERMRRVTEWILERLSSSAKMKLAPNTE